MEENFNWNLASNAQLREEIDALSDEFETKQGELKELVNKIDDINNQLIKMSEKYNYIKGILTKREGKNESK